MTRGERKQDVARFDWANRRLETRRETVELPPLAQDLLSFPFHLAMTIREDSGTHLLHVTNGRKLRDYYASFMDRAGRDAAGIKPAAPSHPVSRRGVRP